MYSAYPSKNGRGMGRSIGVIWGASVAGGQDSGGDGAYSWFDQWWWQPMFYFFVLVFVLMMVVGMGGAQCQK